MRFRDFWHSHSFKAIVRQILDHPAILQSKSGSSPFGNSPSNKNPSVLKESTCRIVTKVLLRNDKVCNLQGEKGLCDTLWRNHSFCTWYTNPGSNFVDFLFFGSGEIKPKYTVPGLYEGHRSSCWLNDLGQKFEHVFHPISKLIGRQFCEFRYWISQFYRQSETRLSSFVLVRFGGQGMFILNSIPLWVSTLLSKDSPVGEASEGNPR